MTGCCKFGGRIGWKPSLENSKFNRAGHGFGAHLEELKGAALLQFLENCFQVAEAPPRFFHVLLERFSEKEIPSISEILFEWEEILQKASQALVMPPRHFKYLLILVI